MDDTLSWEKQLASKLRYAGYSVRYLKSVMSQKSLRTVYISYVHCTMLCGIICWGNSPYSKFFFWRYKKE